MPDQSPSVRLALGIDTGGTYTDAVLVDHDTGQVLATAKALTTRHDLTQGIDAALSQVMTAVDPAGLSAAQVALAALSTTLATNAVVEQQRGTVCLLLLGYDRTLMERFGFERELATGDVVYLAGGHDASGAELAPLDERALRAAVQKRRDCVEAFAISGYFSVRNPTHELRAKAIVEAETGLPVTCGHELTSRLDAVRRAATVTLNAHLILPLRELIASVRSLLAARQIIAPLMVVKGDGSLVRDDWAMQRPIETVLSGPAASAVGARHLTGVPDAWVVDVGGTTTDLAILRDGRPGVGPEGASVGGWRTMVEAIAAHTVGLGGDSHVRLDPRRRLVIGPRRVVPLCLLARDHPWIAQELAEQAGLAPGRRRPGILEYVVQGRRPGHRLAEEDSLLLAWLDEGPRSVAQLTAVLPPRTLVQRRVEELETRGLIRRAGFTPTDALHVLGQFQPWDAGASRLAAALLGERLGLSATALCAHVVNSVSQRIAAELVSKAMEEDGHLPQWAREPAAGWLLQRALDGADGELACSISLRRPLVGVGAPAAAFLPAVARSLHTDLCIPPFAEVANAIGAVAGGVVQRQVAWISPWPQGGDGWVRAHLPDGVHDFASLEQAVVFTEQVLRPAVEQRARQAGAEQVSVQVARQDQLAPVGGALDGEVYLGTEMIFTATGRPSALAAVGQVHGTSDGRP